MAFFHARLSENQISGLLVLLLPPADFGLCRSATDFVSLFFLYLLHFFVRQGRPGYDYPLVLTFKS
jgi:hypothetical protein